MNIRKILHCSVSLRSAACLAVIALALTAFSSQASAQSLDAKIIERNEKRTPNWIGLPPEDAMVVETEAPTLSEARDKAVREIGRRVVEAVALNVTHSTSQNMSHKSDGDTLTESESFSASTETMAARIPFIKGISLTEAREQYWEKLREKKSGRIFYKYAVLYPLSKSELAKMRDEYTREHNSKKEALDRLQQVLHSVDSSEAIADAIAQLTDLQEYFIDSSLRSRASTLRKSYTDLYKGITAKSSPAADGKVKVSLLLEGRPFKAAGRPQLTSNCCKRLNATHQADGSSYVITYDAEDCLPDEENYIDFTLRLKHTRISHRIFL